MISVSITDSLDPQGRCGLQVESRWGPDEQWGVAAVREPLIGNWQELGGGGLAGSSGGVCSTGVLSAGPQVGFLLFRS